MKAKAIGILMMVAFGLSACGSFSGGGFSLNPFSWFGSDSSEETVSDFTIQTVADPRPLVDTITSLTIERTPGGAIVRATGLPTTQGWHTANLVAENGGNPVDGILTYSFRAVAPIDQQRVSTVQSREIVAGKFLSDIALASVRQIRVVGARNIRSIRR